MTEPTAPVVPHRREEDGSFLCRVARIASLGWDWVDHRQLDAWLVTVFTLTVTYKLTEWSILFASGSPRPGLEVAAIIAAVNTPWAALQAAVVKFVFDAREKSFVSKPAE